MVMLLRVGLAWQWRLCTRCVSTAAGCRDARPRPSSRRRN